MPKKPIDCSKCCIFLKLEHINKDDLVYVGNTTNFTKRKNCHKSCCNNENKQSKLYQMIRDNGGFEMFRMIEIEKYPCNDKREAEKRESEVMKEFKAELNSMIRYVSEEVKKKYKDNYKKKYFEANKDKILKRVQTYRDENEEKIKIYIKGYRKANKEGMKEYQKMYGK